MLRNSLLTAILCLTPQCFAATTIRVALDPSLPVSSGHGRLIVFLIADDAPLDKKTQPIDGPFDDSVQPIFAATITNLGKGAPFTLDDSADGLPYKLSALLPGGYRAQARLDTQTNDSRWRREPGNLFSNEVHFVVPAPGTPEAARDVPVDLVLSQIIKEPVRATTPGLEWFAMPSNLLAAFRKELVTLRAGVILPADYDPAKKYAAIYFVPGFGGDDRDAQRMAAAMARGSESGPARELARSTFLIMLNPEGPNGHSLFADSANNGPCARALIEELIPALEAKYPLIAKPEARLLRGHSSGGWSTLWLALQYPTVFGATWSTSPDPVDFRALQTINIYDDANFFTTPGSAESEKGSERPSVRSLDKDTGKQRIVMSVRRESQQEDILGPDNTSAQQWDSWFAVAGPRNSNGHPAALFDPVTGIIDHAVSEHFRKYDINALVRADPERYLPIIKNNVRLVCGNADNFFLNLAVELFMNDVSKLTGIPIVRAEPNAPSGTGKDTPADQFVFSLTFPNAPGYIKLLPGLDHGSIFGSAELRNFPQEMLDHLKAHGLVTKDAAP